ncbi:restriction endonuclease subunit S [Methylobacter sp. BlB1]|uniref:restriction endonuclease subunit S n=1 Tax=Methylobacter sp. BlB1 TaxID=2785914 RepID=UPI001895B1DE|nr:restriction endonuclease subunit S [Methylobacter sp. BlB1]MBF6650839.1 restriction endonuclease subunit S [Methylobacter sp. BlB1]
MSELPSGWIQEPLQSLVSLNEKLSDIEDDEDCGFVPMNLVPTKLLGKIQYEQKKWGDCKKGYTHFKDGDVLLAKITPCFENGKSVLVSGLPNGIGAGSTEYFVLRSEFLDSRYLHAFAKTKQFKDDCSVRMTGSVGHKRVPKDYLLEYRIPVAPLNEQIRIADKLDNVLAKVDAAQARLEKIPTLLKRFRQSVLAAATSGELTREWRETNGIHLNQWSWKKLSDIAEIQGGVTKDSKKQSDVDEEIPYLRVANVQRGYLDLTEIKTIRIPSSKLEKLLLESGDVLFNEGGDLDKLGRGWIWENQITRCSFQNHVFRARLYDSTNNPKYVSWWGNTEGHEYFIRQGKQTTNLASINKTILSNLPINMPPTEEQKEIVRRVESLFTLADTVEKQYLAAKQRLDRLTQSLLAKAFRGELVPQDPNDEPAAELLKRIQAERNAQPPVKNKRKQQA